MKSTLDIIATTLRKADQSEVEIYRLLLAQFIGTPYVYGGSSIRGSDCSGSVCAALSYARNVFLRVTADELYRNIFTEELPLVYCEKREKKICAAFFLNKAGKAVHVAGYAGKGVFVNVSSIETGKTGQKRGLFELRRMYSQFTMVIRAFNGEEKHGRV